MTLYISLVLFGLVQAGVLILLATGLASVFSIMRIPNFAQVGVYLVGGYTCYLLFASIGLPAIVGMFLSAVVGVVLTVVIWFLAFKPLLNRPRAEMFVAAFGAFTVLQNGLNTVFGPNSRAYPTLPGSDPALFGLIPLDRAIIIVVAAILVAGLHIFHSRTLVGKAGSAVAQNAAAAERCGISASKIILVTLAIGGALGGLGGALYGGIGGVDPQSGQDALLSVFAILIVGGMGSIGGAAVAGVVLSVASSFLSYYASAYSEIVYFVVAAIILIVKPTGLFGTESLGEVDVA